jgi:hypothetical protein
MFLDNKDRLAMGEAFEIFYPCPIPRDPFGTDGLLSSNITIKADCTTIGRRHVLERIMNAINENG